VAIGSGVVASSLTLTAFGIDRLIELASAGVLLWRRVGGRNRFARGVVRFVIHEGREGPGWARICCDHHRE
jgi:hypothetical protein